MQKLSNNKYFIIAIVAILSFLSFFLRFSSLNQTDFANGWDGYFYLVQLKSFFEEGQMHSSDYSLIYPLMFFIKWLSGDYVLTYKITSAVLAGFFTLIMYIFVFRWSKNSALAFFAAAFTAFSPQLTFFVSQYPKNLLGVDLLLLYMAFFRNKYKALPVGLFILNLFGHRVTFILAIVFTICMFVSKKHLRYFLYGLGGMVVLVLVTVLVPGLINIHDFERFSGEFTAIPHFSPLSFIHEFSGGKLTTIWKTEIIFSIFLFVSALIFMIYLAVNNKLSRIQFSLVIIFLVLVFPFLKWSLEGFSFRLYLIFVILIPVLFVYLPSKINKILLGFAIGLIVLSFYAKNSYNPEKHDPPYAKYEVVSQKVKKSGFNIELIIGHKALAEYVTFSSGIDVMPWIPDYEVSKEKLWRIASDARELEIEYYIGEENMKYVKRLNSGYFLIREDLWQLFLKQIIEKDNDTELYNRVNTWKNPSEVRPYYLGKNRS